MNPSVINHLSVVIADRHEICRLGIHNVLENAGFEIKAAFAASAEELQYTLRKIKCNLLFIGICHPSGLQDFRLSSLRKNYPKTKIISIVPHELEEAAPALVNAGMHGLLSKDTSPGEMKKAITKIMDGHMYIAKAFESIIANRIASQFNALPCEDTPPLLDEEEKKLLRLIHGRVKTVQIAEHFNCTPKNIEYHRKQLYKKFGVNNQVDFILKVVKFKLAGEI